jgi:hypothetical protein
MTFRGRQFSPGRHRIFLTSPTSSVSHMSPANCRRRPTEPAPPPVRLARNVEDVQPLMEQQE